MGCTLPNFNDKLSISEESYALLLIVFFLFTEYEVIKDQPGDSYYVRAMFDRLPDPQAGPHQLSFRKDDILFIDNTMYNGVPGHWSAWLVDLGKGPYINYVST